MRLLYLFVLAMMAATAFATKVEIAVVDRNGADAVRQGSVNLEVRTDKSDEGVETYSCRVTGKTDAETLVRLEARLSLDRGKDTVFDGRKERPLVDVRTNAFLIEVFPMGAAWGRTGRAEALALGAEAGDSYVDFISSPDSLVVSVRAALMKKGSVYETVFHRIPFDSKYGAMDAFARYYALYPQRFKRNPKVDPALNGINAQYSSWRNADPESCRFMNATWECCIGASRTWGDVNDSEQPRGERNTAYSWDEEIGYRDRFGRYHREKNGMISQQKFDAILTERLGHAYYCGVRNAYYVMALANISNEIAKRHPDSVAVGRSFADGSYLYSTEVFTFPECSWGQDIRRQLRQLAERDDVSAVYFDVSRPRGVYRGEKLKVMKNVSWDEFGPGVMRSVASARLFEYVRSLTPKNSRYRMGVTLNTKYAHITDIFYSDSSDSECCPWDQDKPFPLERRLAAGEKGYQLWEGFSPCEFDPNFNRWPKSDKRLLLNALSKFAVHASFRTGASLPVAYMSEYTALMSHAFVRVNDAGWKPVTGARMRGIDWEIARYGLGSDSWLAVNNLSNSVRRASVEVYPSEIMSGFVGGNAADGGWLFVPFFGGKSRTEFFNGSECVSFDVGAQLTGVLEAVGELKGQGSLEAEWSGDFDAIRLRLVSHGFVGQILPKACVDSHYMLMGGDVVTLGRNDSVEIVYQNRVMRGALSKIRLSKGFAQVRHAPDKDSKDMAESVMVFFAKAAPRQMPKLIEDKGLAKLSVAIDDVVVDASDRWELTAKVRMLLNVINRERFPGYRPPVGMDLADRDALPFLRF